MVELAMEFWTEVAKAIPAWGKVKNGDLKALELRQESISSHAVVLRALGAIGADLLKEEPGNWRAHLMDLTSVDWSKKNRDWENVCIVANSVVSNRQARFATKAYLKRHLKLALNEAEERALASNQPEASSQVTDVVELMEKMSQTEQSDFLSKAKAISQQDK
jgi:DNA sulfur modification protein DndB